MTTEDIQVTDEVTDLKAQVAAWRARVDQANSRAYRAENDLTNFKEAVVQEAKDYLEQNGECSTVHEILDNLGLELPAKTVTFDVLVRVSCTVTLKSGSDQDPDDYEFLSSLVSVDSDGAVSIDNHGDVEDSEVQNADLESIENIEVE
jgi:hypothetical protein